MITDNNWNLAQRMFVFYASPQTLNSVKLGADPFGTKTYAEMRKGNKASLKKIIALVKQDAEIMNQEL